MGRMASSVCFLLFVCSVLLHGSRCDEIAEEEGVLVLTEANFEQALQDNENILVEFYAPWCGHCKSLAPEYASAAKQLQEDGSSVRLGKVDATIEKALQKEYQIKGFPTLKFFNNGKAMEYSGGRTSSSIVSWLKKRTGPPAAVLADLDAAKTFVGDRSLVVIGLFADDTSDAAKAFLASARDAPDDIPYAITSSADVGKEYGIDADVGVVIARTFDEPRVVYDGDNYTADAITAFVTVNSLPLVIEFSQENAPRIFSGKTPRQFLYFGSKNGESYDEHYAVLRELATKYKGSLLFVVFDTEDEENIKILDVFGLTTDALPAVRIIQIDTRDMKKYQPESAAITADVLTPFVDGVLDGSIKVTLKTEDVPEDWDAKPVKIVVGKNFHDVVINNEKHVFIQFYAPWCGHCKKLMPIWDKVGEHFAKRDDYVVAKMDATANEVEGLKVDGFPTIKYFLPNGKSRPINYTGKRELESLLVFLEGGGRTGGTPGETFPVPKKPDPEPADFEAEDEEDIPLEETEEEKEILAEAEAAAAAEDKSVKEEL